MLRSKITAGFVDEAIPFIAEAAAAGRPFYVNLWPDDVHSPFWPPVDKWGDGKRELFLSVLQEMDSQLGKLFTYLRDRSVATRQHTRFGLLGQRSGTRGRCGRAISRLQDAAVRGRHSLVPGGLGTNLSGEERSRKSGIGFSGDWPGSNPLGFDRHAISEGVTFAANR